MWTKLHFGTVKVDSVAYDWFSIFFHSEILTTVECFEYSIQPDTILLIFVVAYQAS